MLKKLLALMTSLCLAASMGLSVFAEDTDTGAADDSGIVTYGTPDPNPPELVSFAIDKTEVEPGDTITVTATATDDISGVSSIQAVFYNSENDRRYVVNPSPSNPEDEIYIDTIEISTYELSGTFYLQEIAVFDNNNNLQYYYSKDFEGYENVKNSLPLPEELSFTVTSLNEDNTPPVLVSFSMDKTNVEPGDTITVTAEASDDMSGVFEIAIWFRNLENAKPYSVFLSYLDLKDGVYTNTFEISKYESNLTFQLVSISVIDNSKNTQTYYSKYHRPVDENDLPLSQELSFTVTSSISDDIMPALKSFSIDKTAVSAPDTITAVAEVTGDTSDIDSISVTFRNSENDREYHISLYPVDSATGIYTNTIEISQYELDGTFELKTIYLRDSNKNAPLYQIYCSKYYDEPTTMDALLLPQEWSFTVNSEDQQHECTFIYEKHDAHTHKRICQICERWDYEYHEDSENGVCSACNEDQCHTFTTEFTRNHWAHYRQCQHEGCNLGPRDYGEHTFDKNNICTVCKEPKHVIGAEITIDHYTHRFDCETCKAAGFGDGIEELHKFDDNNTCVVCKVKKHIESDEFVGRHFGHGYLCLIEGCNVEGEWDKYEETRHKFDSNNICIVCGERKHEWSEKINIRDQSVHGYKCSVEGCDKGIVRSHVFVNGSNVCDICGYSAELNERINEVEQFSQEQVEQIPEADVTETQNQDLEVKVNPGNSQASAVWYKPEEDNKPVTKESSLEFKAERDLSDFVAVLVNGQMVDSSNYFLSKGSSIVTFLNSYLDTLESGEYDLSFVFVDETGDSGLIRTPAASFTIAEGSAKPPVITEIGAATSGGNSSDNDSDTNYMFWQDVTQDIKNAKSGDTITIDAGDNDSVSSSVFRAMRQNPGVSLEIKWGRKTITIPAGKAPNEPGRIVYPLSYLASIDFSTNSTAAGTSSNTPVAVVANPSTGAA